jgi:hypothetical protein
MNQSSRIARRITVMALAVAALYSGAIITPKGHAAIRPESLRASELDPNPLGRAKLAGLLMELSLGPESLCACQVSTASIAGFIESAKEQLQARTDDITAAETRIASARSRLSLANQHQPSSPDEVAAATTELETARAANESLRTELFQQIVQGLTPDQAAALARVRANRQWGVPVQYLVTDRPPADWVGLRDALAAAKDAAAHQRPVDTAVQAIIATADSDSATAAAAQALAAHRAECRIAWGQAAGG